MNGVTVTIKGSDYSMRWEIGPMHEFDTLHPGLGGASVAWAKASFDMQSFFALWCMCLRCHEGEPKMTEQRGLELMQDFLDEGHTSEDAYDLIGEAGIAGHFLEQTAKAEAKASPQTPEGGTTAPVK